MVRTDQTERLDELVRNPGAQLVVIQGHRLGQVVALAGARLTIGRAPDNDLVLESTAVSRQHARLEHDSDRWAVVDLGSRNGVLVNGRAVGSGMRLPLAHRDIVQIAEYRLLLLEAAAGGELRRLTTIQLDRSRIGAEADQLLRELLGEAGS